ncbi:MAG: fumarylacetoacetate hydrolase family protein [Planctomycetota bacterium]
MLICRLPAPDGKPEYAFYRDHQVCPLRTVMADAPREFELFDYSLPALAQAAESADWVDAPAQLLIPVPPPEKVFCIGLNYRDHAIETGSPIPTEPVVFSKFNSALIGHGDSISLPSVSSRVDYEAELVVVMGREAKNVSAEDALAYVFGYTCGHDVSARDWQKGRPGGQWLLGKTFDTFGPVGPCIAPASSIDLSDLPIQMELNGHVVQSSTTAQLIFDVPAIIEHLSKVVTLQPGDLIFTGTPPGVGDAKDPPVYLKEGDLCSVKIDGIGTLSNPCVRSGNE